MKQLVADPWENIAGKYPEGTRLSGKVTNLRTTAPRGAGSQRPRVPSGDSLDVLGRPLRHPDRWSHVGDEVEVVVLSVDPDKKRISLSAWKQVRPNPWDIVAEKYRGHRP